MKALIYDIEIVRAIPDRGPPVRGVIYCNGWQDHINMGVSCIGAYDYIEERYRVFTVGNFDEFLDLARSRQPLVGWNNCRFDNPVIEACLPALVEGWIPPFIPEARCYDLLREVWVANGLGPEYRGGTHNGYGLEAVSMVNGFGKKTGNGALAPIWWQQGHYGKVIDYCLNDVYLTRRLFDLALENRVKDPKTQKILNLRAPA